MIRAHWVAYLGMACVAAAQQPRQPQDKQAAEWNSQGLDASGRGDYAEAEADFLKAIDAWSELGPGYDAHRATAIMNRGQNMASQGNRKQAAAMFEEAVGLYRKTVGVNEEHALTAINLLASVDLMLGEPAKAEALFNEVLPIERKDFPNHLQLSRTLAGLAILNTNRGLPNQALPLGEEALRIAVASEGEISMDVALDYTVLAEVHRVAHRGDRALPLYRKARAIYEKVLGPDHTRVASILGQEGLILLGEGKFGLAEAQMTRALKSITTRCPNCIVEQWVAECNLGILRFRQKRYQDADALLTHALELQESATQHPGADMATTIQMLAVVRQKLNRPEDAARLNRRADMLMSLR